MRTAAYQKLSLLVLLSSIAFTTFAWNHGVSLGYGGGTDINHSSDTNFGQFLTAEFLSIKQNTWYNFTFDGSLGNFYSSTPINNHLFTGALTLDWRPYLFNTPSAHPYVFISSGPGFLSARHFGQNNQGSNFAFQSMAGVGIELGKERRLDFTLRFVHYSNAYTIKPNQGFNIFYIGSFGYLF